MVAIGYIRRTFGLTIRWTKINSARRAKTMIVGIGGGGQISLKSRSAVLLLRTFHADRSADDLGLPHKARFNFFIFVYR